MASPSDPTASMPLCAMNCLLASLQNSSCSFLDQECICLDTDLTARTTACVMDGCTLMDSLIASNVSRRSCGIEPNQNNGFAPTLIVLIVLAGIFVLLRLAARLVGGMKLGWDDLFNFLAMLLCLAFVILSLVLKRNGFGTDMWAVNLDQIAPQLRGYYILVVLYVIARALIRISLTLFYLRVFKVDPAKKWMRATVVSSFIFSVPWIFGAIFICTPISTFWNSWGDLDGRQEKCINEFAFVWSAWVILLVNDFWIMAVPLPFIAKLQLPLRKKILASAMFCAGLVVVGISIYKLFLIDEFTRGTNITYGHANMAVWAGAEICVGVICAAMPSLPALRRHCGSSARSTKRGTTNLSGTLESSKGPRYSVLSDSRTSGNRQSSRTLNRPVMPIAEDPPPYPAGHGTSHIQMVTTIRQDYERAPVDIEIAPPMRAELGTPPQTEYWKAQAYS